VKENKLTVIDFFCGAGGFSEGFREMGFEILNGYDHWKPAIDTFNHNFGTNSTVKNILDFKDSIEEINAIEDTDIIIGSPPCVSFSSSNKSGKADKSLGVQLTECFLRIVAVKKHQKNSKLKAWFMENVVNSKRYLQPEYTFKDLNLESWAHKNKISPLKIAIKLTDNTAVINSAEYGSLQARKRLISGEIISEKKLIIPKPTHKDPKKNGILPNFKTISEMKNIFPSPFSKRDDEMTVKDPQFKLTLKQTEVTDHFYDTGIYAVDSKFSKHWKTNHPYMGKMAFPENENKPSRTITATRIANSRESIIYKSEINRKGDGEYRLPTIREAAILMGFPITFQFVGSEYTKWRLIGNAVCATVSRNFAKTVLETLKLNIPHTYIVEEKINLNGIENLNTFKLKTFNKQPIKNKGAKCRWHTFKDGNLTVTLSNFRIGEDKKAKDRWYTSIQYGTGEGYPSQKINDNTYKKIEPFLSKHVIGKQFIEIINNGFSEKIASKKELQNMFELQKSRNELLEPTELIEELKSIIESLNVPNQEVEQKGIKVFKKKDKVPLKQLFALYGINKITSTANGK
jgi:DNA (cytosine-5)-methyltransferase 1